MADPADLPVKPPRTPQIALGTETAPFVYFDGVSALGVNFGAVQIEVAANVVVIDPSKPNGTRTDIVTTAHLRCSPNAAADLRHALDKALEMFAKSQEPQQAPSRLN